MQIASTSDVDLEALKLCVANIPDDWEASVDEEQVFMRAMDVPSWVSIAADAQWWKYVLAATAAVYVHGIVSEAGKDTWKNRGKLAEGARVARSKVSRLADLIMAARKAGSARTFVTLSIPLPNQYHSIELKLDYDTQDELEFEIALFVHHVPAIEELVIRRGLNQDPPVGGINLEFGVEDFSILASWMDRRTLDFEQEVLKP